jgi:hypothetical protein
MQASFIRTTITSTKGGKMARNKSLWVLTVTLSLAMLGILLITAAAVANDVPRMTKEELKGLLGDPNVIVLDVRSDGDWNASELRIKGAIREDPTQKGTWFDKYPKNKTFVLYCA